MKLALLFKKILYCQESQKQESKEAKILAHSSSLMLMKAQLSLKMIDSLLCAQILLSLLVILVLKPDGVSPSPKIKCFGTILKEITRYFTLLKMIQKSQMIVFPKSQCKLEVLSHICSFKSSGIDPIHHMIIIPKILLNSLLSCQMKPKFQSQMR